MTLAFHLALCLAGLAPRLAPVVPVLDSMYQAGNYERVVELAPAFLADSARSAADSCNLERTCAFALVALGRNDEAAKEFRTLLARDPNLTLDPETVSPKIRAVFDAAKTQALLSPPPSLPSPPTLRPRPMPLSVLIPGLYQAQSGRRVIGYSLLGATGLTLAGLVFSQVQYNDARAGYLSASTPPDIAGRYRAADDWSHARLVLSGTAVAFWLVGLITALRSP